MASLFPKPTWRAACRLRDCACPMRRGRLVLIEPRGLLRDGLAYVISTHLREAAVECYGCVEDVIPGPANLLLIGVDPRGEGDAESVGAKFRALRALCGEAPVGVVLPYDDTALARALCALGIAGVVPHEASVAIAVAAIQLMWVGGFCLPPESCRDDESAPERASLLQAAPATALPTIALTATAYEPDQKEAYCESALTSRECDVLRILREGRQNKIIAFELGISESTVKVHLRNIMKKLHASNRTQVALGAVPAH